MWQDEFRQLNDEEMENLAREFVEVSTIEMDTTYISVRIQEIRFRCVGETIVRK